MTLYTSIVSFGPLSLVCSPPFKKDIEYILLHAKYWGLCLFLYNTYACALRPFPLKFFYRACFIPFGVHRPGSILSNVSGCSLFFHYFNNINFFLCVWDEHIKRWLFFRFFFSLFILPRINIYWVHCLSSSLLFSLMICSDEQYGNIDIRMYKNRSTLFHFVFIECNNNCGTSYLNKYFLQSKERENKTLKIVRVSTPGFHWIGPEIRKIQS